MGHAIVYISNIFASEYVAKYDPSSQHACLLGYVHNLTTRMLSTEINDIIVIHTVSLTTYTMSSFVCVMRAIACNNVHVIQNT